MTTQVTTSPKVIKRYANRKLYDTETSKYTTLRAIVALVAQGQPVQIIENTTKNDITAQTLVMALVETEQELGGQTEILQEIFQAGGLSKYVAGFKKALDVANGALANQGS